MQKTSNEELNRLSVEAFRAVPKIPLIVILDNVRSALNVGSVFRTADAFAVESVYLCGITAQPPDKEIQKTALGATMSVNWRYFDNTLQAISHLKENGYRIFAIEQVKGSRYLNEMPFLPPVKTAFIFGHEVNGVEQAVIDRCDGCIEIPQSGTKHSLNIAVSAGIVIWEYYRQVKKR